MLNNYIELWVSSNANWAYDGDELFNPLHTAAASTVATFTPGGSVMNPFPILPTALYPMKKSDRVRAICAGLANIPFFSATVSFDAGFSGDYLLVNFFYSTVTSSYNFELFGNKSGGAFNVVYDTGIPLSADRYFDLELIISPTGFIAKCENVILGSEATGWDFSQVGYIDTGIQRTNAGNQGELYRTQIEAVPFAIGLYPMGMI